MAPGAGSDADREKCRYCGKKGHWARECRKKKRDEAVAAANLTQAEEGEHGLHMATVVELEVQAPTDAVVTHGMVDVARDTEVPGTGEKVFLNEERARVQFRRSPSDTDAAWYLDTGASNHMTGDTSVFSELEIGRAHV